MATTQLANVYTPLMYTPDALLRSTTLLSLINSGVVVNDERINQLTQSAARVVEMPFYNDLADTEANIGTDDPANVATPQNITGGTTRAVKHFINQGWQTANLARALASRDPATVIQSLVRGYFDRQRQRRLLQSLVGILADNEANDSGDMVIDASAIDSGAGVGIIAPEVVLDTKQTAGDAGDDLFTMIWLHSVQWTNLQKQLKDGQIQSTIDPTTGVRIRTLNGWLRIVVNDNVPVTTGPTTYHAVLAGPGAFGFGLATPPVPSEIDRVPAQGLGEGMESLWVRDHHALHAMGFDFTDASVASTSPTWAEMALATNWDRKHERKLIPIAFLKTLG